MIDWSDSLRLGLPEVDAQHLELAEWINRLEVAVHTDGADPLAVLDSLYSQTRDHFSFEEALMAEINFAGAVDHRREHLMLVAELKSFIAGVRKGSERLDASALEALRKWLVGHIVGSDRVFVVQFLESRNSGR